MDSAAECLGKFACISEVAIFKENGGGGAMKSRSHKTIIILVENSLREYNVICLPHTEYSKLVLCTCLLYIQS